MSASASRENGKRKKTTERLIDWKVQDEETREELAATWSNDLTRRAAARGIQPADADDVGQEAMLATLTRPDGWKPKGKLRHWMRGVARNMAKDVEAGRTAAPLSGWGARDGGGNGEGDGEPGVASEAAPASPVEGATSREEGPRTAALRREMLALTEDALARLDPLERAAVRGLYMDGSTVEETARAMGLPTTTVWRLARSGLQALRGELRDA